MSSENETTEETAEETASEETTEETTDESSEETSEETTEETAAPVAPESDANALELERLRGIIAANEMAASAAQATIEELREELSRAYKSVPSDNGGGSDASTSDDALDWNGLAEKATSKESD